jgi:hypothetical protein
VVHHLRDARAIEHRLLELAHTTDAKITAPALAYFAPCSIEDADRVLGDLAARERVTMEIEDDGTIVYDVPGRQRMQPRALVPAVMWPPPARDPERKTASPAFAAVLSIFLPGAGHLYAGRAFSAILWFLVVSAGYVLFLPGLVLHLFNIASAANAARATEPRLLAAG